MHRCRAAWLLLDFPFQAQIHPGVDWSENRIHPVSFHPQRLGVSKSQLRNLRPKTDFPSECIMWVLGKITHHFVNWVNILGETVLLRMTYSHSFTVCDPHLQHGDHQHRELISRSIVED